MRKLLLAAGAVGVMAMAGAALAQQLEYAHRAMSLYAVTVSSTAVNAVTGPANGCNISSSVALIIDATGNAAPTAPATTAQLQAAGAAPYQCGLVPAGRSISVNCSGGGTCSWQGDQW